MAKLHMLWLALEAIPGAEAVIAEWQLKLAEDFDSVRSLLRPTDRTAGSYPTLTAAGFPYRVVEHGPDDFVAVPPDGNEVIQLNRLDVLIHQIDRRKLAKEIAAALDFTPAFDALPDFSWVWRIGSIMVSTGNNVAVHLVLPMESDDLKRAIEVIVAQTGEAGILVAPTQSCLQPPSEMLLRLTRGHFVALGDTLQSRDGDKWLATEEAVRLLNAYLHPARNPGDEPLSERAQLVLIAMLKLGASDSDHRWPTDEIAVKALGENADPNALKSVMSDLKTRGLVKSKLGRGGGCWLTDNGHLRASKLEDI